MKVKNAFYICILLCCFINTVFSQSGRSGKESGEDFQPNCSCQLKNGDRLSGRVVAISPVAISMETNFSSILTIRPALISSCQTDDKELQKQLNNLLAINTDNNTEASTPTQPAEANSKEESDTVGDTNQSNKQSPYEWKRNIEFNYAYSRGNAQITDMNLSGGISRTGKKSKLSLDTFLRQGVQDGVDTANLFTMMARHDHKVFKENTILGQLSFFNEIGYEKDLLKKLEHRLAWNGGLTKALLKKKENELILDFGAGVTRETYFSNERRFVGSGLLRFTSEQTLLIGSKFKQEMEMKPDFGELGRYLLDTNISFKAPLSKVLSLRIGALNRFDSKPQERVKRNDFSLFSGLAIEF
jgi:putative salt-induced outer membrane protein YdiY